MRIIYDKNGYKYIHYSQYEKLKEENDQLKEAIGDIFIWAKQRENLLASDVHFFAKAIIKRIDVKFLPEKLQKALNGR